MLIIGKWSINQIVDYTSSSHWICGKGGATKITIFSLAASSHVSVPTVAIRFSIARSAALRSTSWGRRHILLRMFLHMWKLHCEPPAHLFYTIMETISGVNYTLKLTKLIFTHGFDPPPDPSQCVKKYLKWYVTSFLGAQWILRPIVDKGAANKTRRKLSMRSERMTWIFVLICSLLNENVMMDCLWQTLYTNFMSCLGL